MNQSRPSAPVPIVLLRRSTKPAPDGSGTDVLVRANLATDSIARRASPLLLDPDGYAQFVLRLDRRARSSLLHHALLPPDRHGALVEPAYLFLSDRQGGFPAEHFWLEEPDGTLREKRLVGFVDTVVDDDDLDPGRIDGLVAIYAHELGHLVMEALAGSMPRKASNAVHFVTVRTDAWTAFNEGWGEHFQPMAQDHVRWRGQGAAPSIAQGAAQAEGRPGRHAVTHGRRGGPRAVLVRTLRAGAGDRLLDLPGKRPVSVVAGPGRAGPARRSAPGEPLRQADGAAIGPARRRPPRLRGADVPRRRAAGVRRRPQERTADARQRRRHRDVLPPSGQRPAPGFDLSGADVLPAVPRRG